MPGVEDAGLLAAVSRADLAAFAAQSPELARRYRAAERLGKVVGGRAFYRPAATPPPFQPTE
jgi:hypothetical protein